MNSYTLGYTGDQVEQLLDTISSVDQEVNKILSGDSVVGKAAQDAQGNVIDSTYVPQQALSQYMTLDTEQVVTSPKSFQSIDVNGTLSIQGDIIQNGQQYETHAEQLFTANDYIFLRDGAVTGLPQGQYSGLEIIKYNGATNVRLVVDNTGTARIGDTDDEQPLATREESPINGGFARWDATTNRFVTDPNLMLTVNLQINEDRVVGDVVALTDEEVNSLSIKPQSVFLTLLSDTSENQFYLFTLNSSGADILNYTCSYTKSSGQLRSSSLAIDLSTGQMTITIADSDLYIKPSTGIPETDLSAEVQQKLSGSGLTAEEITNIRALLSKVSITDTVAFNVTVSAPAFNDVG